MGTGFGATNLTFEDRSWTTTTNRPPRGPKLIRGRRCSHANAGQSTGPLTPRVASDTAIKDGRIRGSSHSGYPSRNSFLKNAWASFPRRRASGSRSTRAIRAGSTEQKILARSAPVRVIESELAEPGRAMTALRNETTFRENSGNKAAKVSDVIRPCRREKGYPAYLQLKIAVKTVAVGTETTLPNGTIRPPSSRMICRRPDR